jgi:hypothetical protein
LHQKPKLDIVVVTLPYPVVVGDKTLEPGEYKIEQMPDSGDTTVLMISDGNGMKLQTMAMTQRSVDTKPPASSSVSLFHIGNNYYLDRIWVDGNPYGYRLLLPQSVRNREKDAESISIPAR